MAKMTSTNAAITLMSEARRTAHLSTTGIKRVMSACKALGIEGEDLIRVLGWLEVCDNEGIPFNKYQERIWP